MTLEKLSIRDSMVERLAQGATNARIEASHPPKPILSGFRAPELPKQVARDKKMAEDSQTAFAWLNSSITWAHNGFPGYPYLTELSQISEYRALSEAPAGEMVRKWVRFSSNSDQDSTDRIKTIERKLKALRARERFREAAVLEGLFGRAQLYIDLGVRINRTENELPLMLVKEKVPKGSLRSLKVIEPIITSPAVYNANDPTADDYYQPTHWYLLGKKVHDTRLLTFVSRPVPDLLKPAYNFGGMSMSQLAMDCVRNWRRVRDSVTRMVEAFSTSGIKTRMSDVLNGIAGSDNLIKRAQIFSNLRENFGFMVLDKDNEEFFQFNVPLAGLDKLQAQAQEHMAAVGRIPLIVLLGITPSGLNASSEGELQTFYDYIKEQQEVMFRANLEKLVRLIQLSEFGDIDEGITFEFEPLWQLDDEALARIRKSDADAATAYVDMGAVSSKEVRKRLASDQNSGWQGLDVGEDAASSFLDPEEDLDGDPEAAPGSPDAPPAAPAALPAAAAAPAPRQGAPAPKAGNQLPRRHRPGRRR